MPLKIKKRIATEGLVIFGLLLADVLFVLWALKETQNEIIYFFCVFELISLQYILPVYAGYLFIRFFVWAMRTLFARDNKN